jgi:hypothetical protein
MALLSFPGKPSPEEPINPKKPDEPNPGTNI